MHILTLTISLSDVDKQMAINVFLGVYKPEEGEMNVWDLPTDYYLHHTQARVVHEAPYTSSYTKWWESELLSTLPLPLYRGELLFLSHLHPLLLTSLPHQGQRILSAVVLPAPQLVK